jgi:integrase
VRFTTNADQHVERTIRAHVAPAPDGGFYIVWFDGALEGWSVTSRDRLDDLEDLWETEARLKTRRDAQLVAQAWANGLADVLYEHRFGFEGYEDVDRGWRREWWCKCGLHIRDCANVGEAAANASSRRVAELTGEDVAQLIETLSAAGSRRETIRKSVKYLAAVLDYEGVNPNPCRDKQRIRLPHEERAELNPPTAAHVEAVFRLLAPAYRLPLAWLDWSGARVASIELVRVGDYDEPQQRVRLRATTTKTRQALWIELPDALADAVEATLPPWEDRDPDHPLFPGVTADRLRTAIGRACKAAAIPVFSPHDLRHRRISLLHRQGRTWAEIGRLVGQRKLSVTADTYTHVLSDGAEIELEHLLTL